MHKASHHQFRPGVDRSDRRHYSTSCFEIHSIEILRQRFALLAHFLGMTDSSLISKRNPGISRPLDTRNCSRAQHNGLPACLSVAKQSPIRVELESFAARGVFHHQVERVAPHRIRLVAHDLDQIPEVLLEDDQCRFDGQVVWEAFGFAE